MCSHFLRVLSGNRLVGKLPQISALDKLTLLYPFAEQVWFHLLLDVPLNSKNMLRLSQRGTVSSRMQFKAAVM